MENVLFVLFLLKKDVICTEIIIFATEIRKHMMNIAGRNSKEKTTLTEVQISGVGH